MKKIISAALAVVLFAGAAQAQTTEGKERHHGHKSERAFDQLSLTADQKAKLQAIRESRKSELETLQNSGNATPAQRKAIHEKYKTQFQSVLTPAQQEQLKKQGEEWKAKGRNGKGFGKKGGAFGEQAAFYKKELNLTADQENKLKSMFQEFRSKAQDIRSDNNLTQEQKRSQMQSLSQQYMAQGKAVLTPEQAKKFEELKSQGRTRHNGKK